ncbi:MAG TPA: hypothetical protein ENK31_00740, partial [Nannocystis exedens]|nr:hypothetical protein [Nannocystis exedens]
ELLAVYLTEARKARIEDVLSARLGTVTVAIEDPADPQNAAAIVRTAEALGLAEVHAISTKGLVLRGRKTARGASPWIQDHHHASLEAFLRGMRDRGMRIAAACVEESVTTSLAELPVDRPLCVLVGNERDGLSSAARAGAERLFRIPMYGMVESLNVSVATALALFEITARRRRWLAREGDLSDDARADLRVSWYARSLDERLLAALINQQAAERSP